MTDELYTRDRNGNDLLKTEKKTHSHGQYLGCDFNVEP